MDNTYPQPFPPPWADAWGDDRYGLWAELLVRDVRQRMRWVEPGRFLMGSPEDEDGRLGSEGPQHEVTLSQGFWLADTACTQALWLAVMGGNPSDAQDDPQKPVEQVSWDDVQGEQGFCKAMQAHALLPEGTEAVLPTEAQWEYACRAGSTTPFSFGEQITTDQVNYDGNYPYNGGAKGEYRETTVPVKALPANAWGLYQMHGNVLEWCADAMRDYSEQSVSDPSGAMGEDVESRALRGGSWSADEQFARSARRYQFVRGRRRDFNIGFRFALRSKSQPGAGGPRPEGGQRVLRPEGADGV